MTVAVPLRRKTAGYALPHDPKYARTINSPRELPFGTTIEDVDGFEFTRESEGWVLAGQDAEPIGTLELGYPIKVVVK